MFCRLKYVFLTASFLALCIIVSCSPVMVKCAAVNCRSGFRPNKHEKAMIQRGETSPCKKHVFAFPKKTDVRARWIALIRRKDTAWNPDYFGVCELHFKPNDFVEGLVPRTMTKRKRLRLRSNVNPSVFTNYPETARPMITKERNTHMATSSERRSYEQKVNQNQIDELFKQDKIRGLDDLYSKLQEEKLPSGFR